MERDHLGDHIDDPIVELERFSSRFEAEVAVSVLESHGIRALVTSDDADGWLPHVGFATGVRVLVFDPDRERAREVLDAEAPPTPA